MRSRIYGKSEINGNSKAITSRRATHCTGEHVCPSSKHHPHMPNFTPFACVEWRKENVDRTGTEIVVSALMAAPSDVSYIQFRHIDRTAHRSTSAASVARKT